MSISPAFLQGDDLARGVGGVKARQGELSSIVRGGHSCWQCGGSAEANSSILDSPFQCLLCQQFRRRRRGVDYREVCWEQQTNHAVRPVVTTVGSLTLQNTSFPSSHLDIIIQTLFEPLVRSEIVH